MRREEQFGPLPPEKERLLEITSQEPEGSLKNLVDSLRRYHDLAVVALLAPDAGAPGGGHAQARPGPRPRRRRGTPLRPAPEGRATLRAPRVWTRRTRPW